MGVLTHRLNHTLNCICVLVSAQEVERLLTTGIHPDKERNWVRVSWSAFMDVMCIDGDENSSRRGMEWVSLTRMPEERQKEVNAIQGEDEGEAMDTDEHHEAQPEKPWVHPGQPHSIAIGSEFRAGGGRNVCRSEKRPGGKRGAVPAVVRVRDR